MNLRYVRYDSSKIAPAALVAHSQILIVIRRL